MTKPLTHLEAFCSDDAKRGRVWTDGENEWRRTRDDLEARPHGSFWRKWGAQVVAIPGEVTWADGPKTLTPSELTIKAALMLRDEARMLQGEAEKKLGAIAAAVAFRGCDCDCGCDGDGHGDSCDPCLACEVSRIISPPKFTGPSALRNDVPDPSQPAEPVAPTADEPEPYSQDRGKFVVCDLQLDKDNGKRLLVDVFMDGHLTVSIDDEERQHGYAILDVRQVEYLARELTRWLKERPVTGPTSQGGIETESAGDFLARVGMDEELWAKEFCKTTGFADRDMARAWFANAIMAGYDRGAPLCGDHLEDMIEREGGTADKPPTKPPLKVGDRVKLGSQHGNVVWSGLGRVHVEFDGVGAPTAHDQYDIEKIEAEPQVEYPLTYAEAMWAMECGSHVSSERWPGNVYHKDYSFLAFDTDEVKSSWRIVEPATGGEG